MKKILLGFIAIGLLTFVGCDKDDDTDTERTDNQTVNNIQTNSNNSSDNGTTESSSEAKDADGYTYKTVIIGEQEWMAENLRTTKYSDGSAIPNVTDNTEWSNLNTGAWCYYENDSQYYNTASDGEKYGKLYSWYAVETEKLCPTGWHVPTHAEWTVLRVYLTTNGHSGAEGKALKSTSGWKDGWDVTNGNGTDNYGWNGLPGGYSYDDGSFDGSGYYGVWWSSSFSQTSAGDALCHILSYDDGKLGSNGSDKRYGLSVRCLRD